MSISAQDLVETLADLWPERRVAILGSDDMPPVLSPRAWTASDEANTVHERLRLQIEDASLMESAAAQVAIGLLTIQALGLSTSEQVVKVNDALIEDGEIVEADFLDVIEQGKQALDVLRPAFAFASTAVIALVKKSRPDAARFDWLRGPAPFLWLLIQSHGRTMLPVEVAAAYDHFYREQENGAAIHVVEVDHLVAMIVESLG